MSLVFKAVHFNNRPRLREVSDWTSSKPTVQLPAEKAILPINPSNPELGISKL